MREWLRVLRIAGELGAADIEAQTVHIVNSAVALGDDDCIGLAVALQAEIKRQQTVLIQREPQQELEFPGCHQPSREDAVLGELARLSRLSDELHVILEPRCLGSS